MMMKTYELKSNVPDPVIYKLMNENDAKKSFKAKLDINGKYFKIAEIHHTNVVK